MLPAEPPTGFPAIPGYEIESELGRGGMGVVYKARQVNLDRLVALKMILGSTGAGAEEFARFRAEAEAVARLQHPNIVQIHEIGTHDGLPYFSLEYVEGGTLDKKLDGTPMVPLAAAEMLETLARAVQAAHDRGIIHRDLKPANVLLQAASYQVPIESSSHHSGSTLSVRSSTSQHRNEAPKITDFGLAKQLDSDEGSQTRTGSVMGTPSYMAPEQAEGKTREIGPAADIYGLGAVLYAMLTGRPPFQGASVIDTLLQVRYEEPIPPRRLAPNVPADLETICLKCLEKDPPKRYARAGDLAEDVRRFLRGLPIQARPVTLPERMGKWARRHPAVAFLSAAIAVMFVVSYVVVAWQTFEATRGRTSAQRARELAQARADAEQKESHKAQAARQEAEAQRTLEAQALEQGEKHLYFTAVAAAARDLADERVLNAEAQVDICPPRMRHWEWYYLKGLFYGDAKTIAGRGAIALSNDGRLATVAKDGADFNFEAIRIREAATGKELFTLVTQQAVIFAMDFSPVGNLLAVGGQVNGEGSVWSLTTRQVAFQLFGHETAVYQLTFSPDGRLLATSSTQQIKIWNTATGQLVRTLPRTDNDANCLVFSPDGKYLLGGGSPRALCLYETATGKIALTIPMPVSVAGISYRADGKLFATSHRDGTLRIWDPGTGQEVRMIKAHSASALSLVFSPDGKTLVSAGNDLLIKIWSVVDGQLVRTYLGHSSPPLMVRFLDDRTLLSVDEKGAIKYWDLQTRPGVREHRGHTGNILTTVFQPDGKAFASGGRDAVIKAWDAATGRERFTCRGHSGPVYALAYSHDGRMLASGSDDRSVRIWDARSGEPSTVRLEHDGPVRTLIFTPDELLITGSDDQHIRVWDPYLGTEIRKQKAHAGSLTSLAIHPDGTLASSARIRLPNGNSKGEVKLWSLATGTLKETFEDITGTATGVAFSPDGRLLAVSIGQNQHGSVKVWDTRTGQAAFLLREQSGSAYSVAFSPDGQRIITANHDGSVSFWDTSLGQKVYGLPAHTPMLATSAAFSPDGIHVLTGGGDNVVKLWSAWTGPLTFAVSDVPDDIYSLAISPAGPLFAIGAMDGIVKIWDTRTRSLVQELKGAQGSVEKVCYSSDGKRIAANDYQFHILVWDVESGKQLINFSTKRLRLLDLAYRADGKQVAAGVLRDVLVWDAETGTRQFTLTGHGGEIHRLCYSPDGCRLASSSLDNTIRIWDTTTGKFIRHAGGASFLAVALAYSPDGKALAAGGADRSLRICDEATGQQLLWLSLDKRINALAFRGPNHVVGILEDGSTSVWEVATGNQVLHLPCREGQIRTVAISPDGTWSALATFTGAVKHWSLEQRPLSFKQRGGSPP